MPLRTGIDITPVNRVRSVLENYPDRFPSKYFPEIDPSDKQLSAETYAGIWAAKEAVFKVLGRGYRWNGVEIRYEKTGRPFVKIHHDRARLDDTPIPPEAEWDCSITHDGGLALAFAVSSW